MPKCACGKAHESATEKIAAEKNIAPALFEYIRQNFGNNARGKIICDENTYAAAKDIMAFGEPVVLKIKSFHADEYMLDDCECALEGKKSDYFIAAGGGTVHDITRIAAYKRNVPFISFPTAPSVDGFVSGISPITTKNGMKYTIQASAPIALFADTGILAAAPKRLAASGIGDIVGKYIALADWKISHLLTGEYICERIIGLEYGAIEKLIASIDGNYGDFCANLLSALVLSGLCMQYTGNSRPASGAEHHISHFFEMGVILSTDCLHGENVGLGSILCAELYRRFADSEDIRFTENYEIDEASVKKYYKSLYGEIIKENSPQTLKKITPENFYGSMAKIKTIIAEIPRVEEFVKLLGAFGGVTDLCGLRAYGLKCKKSEIKELTLKLAPYIRDRVTLLKIMRLIEFN